MKKFACIGLMVATVSVAGAEKRTDPATLRDLQPTNFAVAKKEHQQYDFSIQTQGRDYQCRTPQNKKVNATDFVVGSAITFESNGKDGEVKTREGKKAKCLITRVENNSLR